MAARPLNFDAQLDSEHLVALEASLPRELDVADLPGSVGVMRERMAERRAQMPVVPLPEGVSVENRLVPGPEGAPDVMVRLYRPAKPRRNAPGLYWIHGGGIVLGSVDMNDPYCAGLAGRLGALIASVEYRLAPEHPFPAPLEDCYAGLVWLASAAETLGIDRARIAIGGASAGSGLAAGLALLARDRGQVRPCFQLLVYPMLDDRNVTNSSYAVTDPRVWNRDANVVGWSAYLAGKAGTEGVSPYAAPARARDLAGLPPAYINVGTLDLFVDEDVAYAQALIAAEVPVELHVYPGVFHGSPTLAPTSPVAQRWTLDETAALERALRDI